MKFNVTVDIEWLNEDEKLDDAIKNEVIRQVVNSAYKISTDELSKINAEASKLIKEKVAAWIDDFLTKGLSGLQVNIGNTTMFEKENVTVSLEEYIDRALKNALGQSVDKNGNVVNSSYDRKGTRLDVITGNIIEKIVDTKVQEQMKNINGQLNDYFTTAMKNELMKQLTGAVVSNIDLNSIFKKQS